MIRPSRSGAQREQRKQDLLLASGAMRQQAVVALDDLAGRADALVSRVAQARAVLSHPAGLLVSGLLGMLVARLALRRRPRTWLRWAWLGWRTWRAVAPTLRAAFAPR